MIGGSTISAIIEGDDLRLVRISDTGLAMRATPLGVAPSALSNPDAVRGMAGAGASRVVLTVPSGWASVRPISVSCAQWRDGEAEIRKSVGGLLPLTSDDAMLGVIDAAGGGDSSATGGYLVGVSATLVRPWLALLERATGRRVDRVLTVQMAMLGLGLQAHEHADVLEAIGGGGGASGGGWLRHRLAGGLVERIGEAWSEGETTSPVAVSIGGAVAPARAVTGDDLAIGAALASRVAGGSFVPLDGAPARAWTRWAMPAAAIAAAAVLLVAGGMWREARLERATARLDARIAEISADVRAGTEARLEAERLTALINSARDASEQSKRKILPLLTAAMDAVPEGGFIYSMQLTPDRLVMQGEARLSGEVVRNIENSPEFEKARQVSPVTASQRNNLGTSNETFDVTAERASGGGESR